MNIDRAFYTVKEFAYMLKVHPISVLKMIKRGQLQVLNVGTDKKKSYRIPITEVQRLTLFELRDIFSSLNEVSQP